MHLVRCLDRLDVSTRLENRPSFSFRGIPCAMRSYIVQENELNPDLAGLKRPWIIPPMGLEKPFDHRLEPSTKER